ncbi:MAG: flagellar motor protein MotB [Oscillospiraceae bacterium]|nr:flagellar motor protein MotB [Oscillospiraceae bacterium]
MRRRNRNDSDGGAGWLTTYADMVTLMLTFFVLLIAMSSMDKGKFELLFTAFQPGGMTSEEFMAIRVKHGMEIWGPGDELNIDPPPPPPGTDINNSLAQTEDGEEIEDENADLIALFQQLNFYLIENDLHESIFLHEGDGDGDHLLITLTSDVWFASGSAEVSEEMRGVALEFAELLKNNHDEENPFRVVVSGHTDDVPQYSAQFRNNWELSSGRANNFMGILISESEIASRYFYMQGYGEEMPIDTNETPEGRQRNRRVELLISRDNPIKKAAEDSDIDSETDSELEINLDSENSENTESNQDEE